MTDRSIATLPELTHGAANGGGHAGTTEPNRPKKGGIFKPVAIALGILVLLGVLFAKGYMPRVEREKELAHGLAEEKTTLPAVNAAEAHASPNRSDLLLPGNITPLTEAIINGRAEGYVRKRYVDIGDRVKAGQVLAEIEAPELDQQVQQARASVSQAEAALGRAQHALAQSQSNAHLSEVTEQRWKSLVDRGVVSRQEFDQKHAQFESDQAAVQSAQADVAAAQDNVRVTEANLKRLIELQGYEKVTAPFSGIVTARNIDVGALITTNGSTPLFKLAQIDVLRIVVDVPEQSAPEIQVGEPAEITLQEFRGRTFVGRVARTANALDATARTLPTEVQVRNPDYALMPNMYANVRLVGAQAQPTVLVPGDALVARPEGTFVAILDSSNRVHFQPVEVGRDYGPEIEIRSGIAPGTRVIVNPTDDAREGAQVNPIMQKAKSAPIPAGGKSSR